MDWFPLPEELFLDIASHWDVATFIEKKRVCRQWNHRCTDAIDAKRTETTQKAFTTTQELCCAVRKYCGYHLKEEDNGCCHRVYSQRCSQEGAKAIASTYGYPINKWDVSKIQDFSKIFHDNTGFNEDIGLWNVSNATSMEEMFYRASAFNQDLSSWDVSNVTVLRGLFKFAESFNQDISLCVHQI
jgi:surface protein